MNGKEVWKFDGSGIGKATLQIKDNNWYEWWLHAFDEHEGIKGLEFRCRDEKGLRVNIDAGTDIDLGQDIDPNDIDPGFDSYDPDNTNSFNNFANFSPGFSILEPSITEEFCLPVIKIRW